jgi:neutral ceramidase
MRNGACFLVASAVSLAVAADAQSPAGGNLRAGAAKLDITPKTSDLRNPTDVIRDHLFARAIVVDDGRTCAALIGFDLSKVDDQAIINGISRAAASTGCPADHFIVSATHTHSSSTQGLEIGPPLPNEQEDIIVAVANGAKERLAPARIGYGTARVHLNVNRELFDAKEEQWRHVPNPEGPSDKTLAVVEFLGADYVPIGVYMNYGMHPDSFFGSGVLSADFPGEASRYIEGLFDNRTVAIFSQAAEGDQNPMFGEPAISLFRNGQSLVEKIGSPVPPTPPWGPAMQARGRGDRIQPVPPEEREEYKRAIELTGANVTMMGAVIGANAVRLMRYVIQPVATGRIWGAQEYIACPTRIRQHAGNPAAGNLAPSYEDGPDLNIRVGVLRIGDIYFATVDGELYSEIGMHLKAASPASQTIVVALANGGRVGYIPSDNAYARMTSRAGGSRIKPGCAESKIISKVLDLIHRSNCLSTPP